MKVLVLYTLPPRSLEPDRSVWEFELAATAANVARPLRKATVRAVEGWPVELAEVLSEVRPDVVFNLCEAPLGRPELEPHAAAFFQWVGVRFTGCGSDTLALCRRKDRTNALLRAAGVAVPDDVRTECPQFPCIVKPAAEDGSAGIHDHSLCHDAEQLGRALRNATVPVIVQQFLPGREFTVTLWGQTEPDYFAVSETIFHSGSPLMTYEAKWEPSRAADSCITYECVIEDRLHDAMIEAARAVWRLVGARHALRIDIRLDAANRPRVLDVNPNPSISPGVGICRAVQEVGWRWDDFVRRLVEWA